MAAGPLICVVDDDESVRESLPDLLEAFGYKVRAYASASAFLASDDTRAAECLILDIAMPVMSGLELQRKLQRRGRDLPVVFITAHADEKVRPRALAQGAVECLFKPFDQEELLNALTVAVGQGRAEP